VADHVVELAGDPRTLLLEGLLGLGGVLGDRPARRSLDGLDLVDATTDLPASREEAQRDAAGEHEVGPPRAGRQPERRIAQQGDAGDGCHGQPSAGVDRAGADEGGEHRHELDRGRTRLDRHAQGQQPEGGEADRER
jgi:hypothetical protein